MGWNTVSDMRGALLVTGTTSDAGKSTVVAGLCRWLARQGVAVAPFKAQNMSNNSMVCPGGGEIGRAQWLQAVAAGVEPEPALNPVLLKPGGDRRSHIVRNGQPWGELTTDRWAELRPALAETAYAALADLRSRYDVVICEGAGSPAEVNLRHGDYVNLGLAAAADLPVVVVGDIDRGGVLAALAGTVALVEPADQRRIAAFVINKFRGDEALLRPGLETLTEITGRPVLGVLPWLRDVWLDSEDTLTTSANAAPDTDGPASGTLRVAAVRFPRVSNATDLDPLAAEPGVAVTVTADPDVVAAADLALLPGTRATVDDLAWLRRTGLAGAITERARAGLPVLGVCGGAQMLGREVLDGLESSVERTPGLALLPHRVRFGREKVLRTPHGTWRGHQVTGYEIHHGVVEPGPGTGPFLPSPDFPHVWATMWHGVLESDGFRRGWLGELAARHGWAWRPRGGPGFAERRETMLDSLADAVGKHLDTEQLLALARDGVPGELPSVRLERS